VAVGSWCPGAPPRSTWCRRPVSSERRPPLCRGTDALVTAWMSLPPAAAEPTTEWQVRLFRDSDGHFRLQLRCQTLDEQFTHAAVRAFAALAGHPHVWTEFAAVVRTGEALPLSSYFSTYLAELPAADSWPVRVRLRWTGLLPLSLPLAPSLWASGAERIQASWQLSGWSVVRPTANGWQLWSEPFGRGGALWRMRVVNTRTRSGRALAVGVWLQHIPAGLDCRSLEWEGSLTLWGRELQKRTAGMEEGEWCGWHVVDDVSGEPRDPLDVVCVIHVINKR
jgi:hypothetical protein